MTHRIGVIGGDGIGPEVLAEALKVLDATGVAYDRTDYDLGAHRYLADGTVLPDEVLEEWRGLDALLLGAVGDPAPGVAAPAGLVERGILLRMRFDLDQYINLRPFRLPPKADFEVIRENTEGTYAGEGGFLRKGTPNEIATQGSVNTRLGVERCVRFAFERAAATDRRHLTLVHKKNVLTFAGDLWQRTFDEVAAEHPDVTYFHELPREARVPLAATLSGLLGVLGASQQRSGIVRRALPHLPGRVARRVPLLRLDDMRSYLRAYSGGGHDYRPTLGSGDVPVTLMVGMNSPLYAPAGQELVATHARRGRVVRFERSGHAPLLDEPLRFQREFARFLRGAV